MFRRQLTGVLLVLAACIVVQAVGAVFALHEAERQVVKGRLASDIHRGFVQLSATKQRLRSWVTQHKIGAGGLLIERDALLQEMDLGLVALAQLAEKAAQLGLDGRDSPEHLARMDAVQVLGQNVQTLVQILGQVKTLPANMPARLGWDTLTEVFEKSEGRDMRQLIGQSIQRESAAMQRERLAADATLVLIRWLWVGMALSMALLSVGATIYFARALRRPLDALVLGAHMLRQGKLQPRVQLDGQDEFSDVARSMNAMAAALHKLSQQETEHRQRLETEVRERTSALHEANAALQQTDTRRRQLLADVSHELRTPTTAIRGEAEITLRGGDRPALQYREALQRIVATSRQLGSVIDDLLAMARSDMETLSIAQQVVDVSEPLSEALAQAAALAGERSIGIVAQPMPPNMVQAQGDAQRLCQLLLLLLDNAVRYSHPNGCVTVAWWICRQTTPTLVLQISDAGLGIPAEDLHQVFDRHFRGDQARIHRAAGSGLGLPIAKALTLAHGGSLTLESPANEATGAGTRVQLRLPLLTAQSRGSP